ncbi:unnamed protein product [marine sediment metagenome]|uniref:ATPase AAA-type core domain-containing protein n=1 Tax=marine sediment metagenome TaxID=412755 RepID=X1BNC4_9ZZZZ
MPCFYDLFYTYSTGIKQELALARGLINDPQILFIDEPTKSLDPVAARNIRKLIQEKLVKEQGKTVFLATHNEAGGYNTQAAKSKDS